MEVALKVQKMDQFKTDYALKQLEKEIEIHSKLCHPHILRFTGMFFTEDSIVTIMELASGGNVFDRLMETQSGFDEKTAAFYISQFIDALDYLHSMNILHRDIKPENVLLTKNVDIQIFREM